MRLLGIYNFDMIEIIIRRHKVSVTPMLVGSLDKAKCSKKFLSHKFPDNHIVYVKCLPDGTPDLRGARGEYRIIVPNEED